MCAPNGGAGAFCADGLAGSAGSAASPACRYACHGVKWIRMELWQQCREALRCYAAVWAGRSGRGEVASWRVVGQSAVSAAKQAGWSGWQGREHRGALARTHSHIDARERWVRTRVLTHTLAHSHGLKVTHTQSDSPIETHSQQ